MASDEKNDIIPSVKKGTSKFFHCNLLFSMYLIRSVTVSVARSFGSEFKNFLLNTQSNPRSSTLAPNGSPKSDGFRGQHSLETRNGKFAFFLYECYQLLMSHGWWMSIENLNHFKCVYVGTKILFSFSCRFYRVW